MKTELVIPSEIPWTKIKGRDLEECLYWLLNSMGAKDIEWRIGGSGDGAADQGRDLEAHFYMSDPDGELVRQRWWIEAKGRSSTVPPTQVKSAVLNAAGKPDLDVLVVATNSTFSNPTRDWVREWQRSNSRPKVRLWDQQNLEKLVCQNPEVAVRLFSEALSPQGRLEVVRSRFWNYAHFASEATLKHIWTHRDSIDFDSPDFLAVQASEFANGKIADRPWGLLFHADQLADFFASGVLNTLLFCMRANDAGTNQTPYFQSMAYLLLLVLDQLGSKVALETMNSVWDTVEEGEFPEDIRRLITTPIIRQLKAELRDVCASDCRRVTMDPVELGKEGVETYWQRLTLPAEGSKDKSNGFLIIEHRHSPCKIGFDVDPDHGCPVIHLEDEESKDVKENLVLLERIIKERRPH